MIIKLDNVSKDDSSCFQADHPHQQVITTFQFTILYFKNHHTYKVRCDKAVAVSHWTKALFHFKDKCPILAHFSSIPHHIYIIAISNSERPSKIQFIQFTLLVLITVLLNSMIGLQLI